MTFQLKHSREPRFKLGKKILLVLFIAVLGLFVFNSAMMRNFSSSMLGPVLERGGDLYQSAEGSTGWFGSRQALLDRINALEEENFRLQMGLADLAAVSYENERLRGDLGLSFGAETVRASVLARSPQVPLDSLFVDKGAEDGIKEGDLVIAGERALLGRVSRVFAKSALVSLFSNVGESTSGFVSRTHEPIVLEGAGGGNILAKAPIDFDLQQGDTVVASYSSNFSLAIVGAIEVDEAVGQKTALLSLSIDAQKAETVFILPVVPLPPAAE